MNIQIKINDSSRAVGQYQVESGAGAKGKALHIDLRGQKNLNVELINEQTGTGPENIAVKRVGKDLHVAFEQSDIANPDVIVEGYYDDQNDHGLIARAEDGLYYYYIPESGASAQALSNLSPNVLTGQALGGESYPTALWPASSGVSPLALIGGALLIGAAAGGGGGGGGGDAPPPPPPPSPPPPAPGNHAPTIGNYNEITAEDIPLTGRVQGSDEDGDTLTYGKGSDPSHGKVTVNPDGSYTYTPDKDYNGPDSFTVTVSDGHGGTTTSTVTIDVTPVNDPPSVGNYQHTVPEDTSVSGRVTGTDVDGDVLTYGKGSNPSHGTVVVNPDGGYTYTPNTDWTGTDTFTVTVDDGHGGTTTSTVTVTVTPDDAPPPALSVAISDAAAVAEGGNLVFTVTLSGGTAATNITIPVTYTGTATDGSDFTGVASVTILAGHTTGTLTVPTLTDGVFEGSETVIANLGTPSLAGVTVTDGSGTGTITDQDSAPTIASVSDATENEGSTLVHTVTLSNGSSNPTTFTFSLMDVTTSAGDHGAPTFGPGVTNNGDGTISVAAGVTSFTVSVPSVPDTIAEGDETYTLHVGTAAGEGTILDNAPTLTVAISDAESVTEGGNLVYTVTLSGGTSATDITIPVTYTGTATDGSDYTGVANVTILAGQTTGTLTVATSTDTIAEGSETVIVHLGTPSLAGVTVTDGTGEGTILDSAPTLTVAISDAGSVTEGGNLVYTVTLTGGTASTDITIPVTYTGMATDGSDYTGVANVTILTGQTTGTLTVATSTDTVAEGSETVIAHLGTPSLAGVTVTDGTGEGTILDSAPTLTVAISDAGSVTEGGNLVYTVTLSGGTSATDITIPVTYTGTATDGSDYTGVANVTILAGQTTGTLTVATSTDTIAEGSETVIAHLGSPSLAGVTVTDATGEGTILDSAPTLTVAISDAASVTEGGNLVYTVTLSGGTSATDITIPVTYTGTATDGSDYTGVANVTILAGQTTGTLTVATSTDTIAEGSETVIAHLGTPSLAGVTVTDAIGEGTILDSAPTLTVAISDAGSVTEGGNLVYTVTLSGGTSATDITIPVTYTGTATDGSDYTGVANVTILAGQTTGTLTVTTSTDTVAEGSETVIAHLGTPSLAGVTVTDAIGEGTILDNAPPLTVAISDAGSVTEGGNLVYTVTLSGGTSATDITIPVTYTGTATDGSDYTGVANVTILAGQTTGTLTVATSTDTIAEGSETVIAHLGTPSLAGVTVTDAIGEGTILDSAPTLTVAISDAGSVTEGGNLVYTVTLSGGTSATDITIPVTYTGTATDGSDYTGVANVTILAGQTMGTLTVATSTDTVAEGSETVIAHLGTPSLAGVTVTDGVGEGTILDSAPTLTVAISDAGSVTEGGNLVYTVTLTGGTASTDITIPVTYTGTATDGSDYTGVANVTILAGQTTGTLTVATSTDTVAEGSETVIAHLGTPSLAGVTVTDATGEGTILDSAPTLTVAISDAGSVTEGGNLVYTVTLSGGTSATDITIPVTYTGTATDGSDYTSVANVTILAGQTTGTLTVATNTDTVAEGSETVIAHLGTPSLAGVTVTDAIGEGTILDSAPTLSVAISDAASVTEGGNLVYTVTLTGGTASTDITIPVTYTGTATDGSDYTGVANVTILAGQTTGTLTVATSTDTVAEGSETVIANLGTPSLAGVTVTDATGEGTILDSAPTLTVAISDAASVTEGGNLVYTVTLSGGTASTDITIPVTYTGTATDGSDYTGVANVTILAGQTTGTLTVATNTDTVAEGSETVIAHLGTPSLAEVTVTDAIGEGTILDSAPTLTVAISDAASVTEGGNLVYTVTLSGGTASTDITIPVTYTGTATDGSDYTGVANVTILAGQTTGTLTVATNTDTVAEGPETVIAHLGTPSLAGVTVTDGTGEGTILDSAPTLTVAISDAGSVTEGSNLVYTVTLSGGTSATDITIPVTYTGTATDGSDYTGVANVTILAGQTTGTLTMATSTDTIAEGSETVIAHLGAPSLAGVTVTDAIGEGTILDSAPTLTVAISDAGSVTEGGNLVYTVTLSGGTASTDITIPVTYTGTATDGSDYTSVANVTILAGQTTGTLTVTTSTDTIAEGSETVIAHLGTPSLAGVTVIDGVGEGTILDSAPTLTVAISDAASVTEGGNLVYTVTLSGGTSATDITIPVTYTGTATDGSDYTGVANVTILAGQTTGTLTVATSTDTIAEGSETVIAHLGTPSLAGVTVTDATGEGTILDSAPTLSVAISDAASVTEGGNLVYTVTLTGGTASTDITIPVTYTGTATDGSDYTGVANVTILAGQTTGTLTVATSTDTIAEGSETVIANLGTPSLAGVTVTDGTGEGTILDSAPILTVAISDAASVTEGGNLIYTVTLSGGTAGTDITIPVTYTGTATDGSDYTGVANVTILAGQTTGTLTVATSTDTIAEGSETVIAHLGTPSLAGVTVTDPIGEGTILDSAPPLTVAISDAGSVTEGGNLVYTVTLSGGTSATDITIPVTYTGTATDGSDYTGVANVTILAGQTTGTLTVATSTDTIAEGSETVIAHLGTPSLAGVTVTDATGEGTILDSAPTLTVAISDAGSVTEGGNLVYTVTLSGGTSATDITIPVTYTGTATDGSDYTGVANVTILAGQTTGTLTVATSTDTVAEGSETVIAHLGTPSLAGVTVTDPIGEGTILDSAPTLTVAISDAASVTEGGNLVYTVTLSGGTSATDITIPVTYTGTATDGSDYTGVANVTILAGQTTGTLTVATSTDTIAESSETVVAHLGTPSLAGVTVTDPIGEGTILDNAPPLTVAISDAGAVSEGGNLVYTITLSGGTSAMPITIPLTYGGSATSGADYTAGPATVTIPAGSTTATVTLTTLNDSIAEANETVTVTLGTLPAGVTATDSLGEGTIIDIPPVPQVPHLTGITSGIVSEEGLSGGLIDTVGTPTDTTNQTQIGGTISITDTDSTAGQLTVALSGPVSGAVTSGGVNVTWTWDAGTHTLTGSAGSTPVMTIAVGGITGTGGTYSASYTATLLGPVDHPAGGNPGIEDVLSMGFSATVSDGVNTSTPVNFSVTVEDDSPRAADASVSASVSSVNTNLMVVLDLSGSMDYDSGVEGKTRLQLAKEAIYNLIDGYDQYGEVRVQVVTFSSSGTAQATWLTANQAKILIEGLSADGGTNYDAALSAATSGFAASGKLSNGQNVSYFLTDGDPSSTSNGINTTEEATWTNFLTTNQINSFALGIGTGLGSGAQANINPIAYNGATSSNTNGVLVTDMSQLDGVLQSTIHVPSKISNLLTGDLSNSNLGFGGDGGSVSKLTIDGTTYSYNHATGSLSVSGTNRSTYDSATHTATITTLKGGTLVLNFATGAYEYQPSVAQSSYSETLGYAVVDRDGDEASATQTLNVNYVGSPRDDIILTDATSASIPISALLGNDAVGGAVSINLSGASSGLSVSQSGGMITFTLTSGSTGSFQYTVTNSDGNTSDVATVNIVRQGNGTGNTVNGTAGREILLGRDGTADTINSGGGADIIYGGTGNDTINGVTQDALLIDGGGGTDTLNLATSFTSTNDAHITGVENVVITANSGTTTLNLSNQTESFTITGSTGTNIISTGSGNDVISAGTGNNSVVNSGAGADKITVNAGTSTTNWAIDLGSGDGAADKIVFSHAGVSQNNNTLATINNFEIANDKISVVVGGTNYTDGSFQTVTSSGTNINANVEVIELVNSNWVTTSLGDDSHNGDIESFIQTATNNFPGEGTYTFIVYSSTNTSTANAGIYSVSITDDSNPNQNGMVVEHVMTINGVGYGNLSASNFVGAADPIILDLNGDGYRFGATASFDVDGDGKVEQVAWNTSNDGMLALDLNSNGTIDSGSELFTPHFGGGQFINGVAALASLDSNHDGILDAQDAVFNQLLIWQDTNHDGISQADEMSHLSDHGITALSVTATATDRVIDGQDVTAEGTVHYADGHTGGYVEVQLDKFSTESVAANTHPLNPNANNFVLI